MVTGVHGHTWLQVYTDLLRAALVSARRHWRCHEVIACKQLLSDVEALVSMLSSLSGHASAAESCDVGELWALQDQHFELLVLCNGQLGLDSVNARLREFIFDRVRPPSYIERVWSQNTSTYCIRGISTQIQLL